MPRPYSLHKRPTTKPGRFVYYVQFRDEYGNRETAISTGQHSKSAAETWAAQYANKRTERKDIRFSLFAQDFWDYEKCTYIRGKLARGGSLSHGYADTMRRYLLKHIMPRFSKYKLTQISPAMIEKWIFLLAKELAPGTVNHCRTCLAIILKEAKRLGYLKDNPVDRVNPLVSHPQVKDILTVKEIKRLFDPSVWKDDILAYSANLLAATSGMRLGEIRALMRKHVHTDYIEVLYSFDKYGFQPPKRNSVRDIPIPRKTSEALQNIMELTPYPQPEAVVFWTLRGPQAPLSQKGITFPFYRALDRIGISQEQRKIRNITFHGHRHFYNTALRRGKIPDPVIRRLTGHRDEAMTERYTQFKVSDFQEVLKIQETLFS